MMDLPNCCRCGKQPCECKLTVGSLFAGIGGIELGLEWTGGFKTVWQVECDPYAQKVLAKHWPDCGRWDDVRTFPPQPVEDWSCDVICGGFPCQDISNAGKRAGIDGERSGLWSEYIRIVRTLRPRFVLVENVAALLGRGMGRVLGDLAESGYDAEWECLQASSVGLYHDRDRLFCLAYSPSTVSGVFSKSRGRWRRQWQHRRLACSEAASKWPRPRFEGEPNVAPLVDGIPEWMGRRGAGKALGNAVVPQVAQWIGERIMEANRLRQECLPFS